MRPFAREIVYEIKIMTPKVFLRIVVVGACCATALFVGQSFFMGAHKNISEKENTDVAQVAVKQVADKTVSIGGPFALIDQAGNKRSHLDFRGRYMLVYFGYTFCPDICPTALYALSGALEKIGDKAKNFQAIFITIDPKRDTVETLAEFAKNFHPSLVFLTGDEKALKKAAKSYHVHGAIVPETADSPDYLMDHSSIIYVMDPRGRYLTSFNHATPAAHISKYLLTLS